MTEYPIADTVDIKELAKRVGCSPATIRRKLDKKQIPQPIKRKSDREELRWLRTEIDKFLGVNQTQHQDGGVLEQMIRSMIRQEVRAFMQETRTIN